jgi:anti-anti-sigma factor
MVGGGTIDVERECGVWLVTLRGEHDLSTASHLRNSLARSFSGGWIVIVDMSEAEFIDSTTLHVLMGAWRQRHPIALVAPSGTVAGRVVELVCLADVIPTYQSRADALNDLAPDAEVAATGDRSAVVHSARTRIQGL